jgi:hypothetical protein
MRPLHYYYDSDNAVIGIEQTYLNKQDFSLSWRCSQWSEYHCHDTDRDFRLLPEENT